VREGENADSEVKMAMMWRNCHV